MCSSSQYLTYTLMCTLSIKHWFTRSQSSYDAHTNGIRIFYLSCSSSSLYVFLTHSVHTLINEATLSLSNLEFLSQNCSNCQRHSRWKSEVSSKLQNSVKTWIPAAHVLSHFFEKETHLKHVYKNTVRNLEKESENIGTLYSFVTK